MLFPILKGKQNKTLIFDLQNITDRQGVKHFCKPAIAFPKKNIRGLIKVPIKGSSADVGPSYDLLHRDLREGLFREQRDPDTDRRLWFDVHDDRRSAE